MGATNCADARRVCLKGDAQQSATKKATIGKDKTPADVRTQRRRLSIQARLVGDITKTPVETEYVKKQNDTKATMESGDAAAKGALKSASTSRKGYVPYNKYKVNQDRAVVINGLNSDPKLSLFGVMDGHGEEGHLVSDFVMKNLRKCLEKQKDLTENPANAISNGVINLVSLLGKTQINCSFSGTTLVFGLLIDRVLHVGNVGDSRAVMARRKTDDKLEAIELSRDHKPEDPKEKKRILAAGGRVHPIPGPPNVDCGPSRVWLGDQDIPGLAMSRSIGDNICRDIGVTSEPEVLVHKVQDNDLFAIWASDGVWEFISNERAIEIVWKNKGSLKKACNELIEASVLEWQKYEEVIDDSTCVIVQFNEF